MYTIKYCTEFIYAIVNLSSLSYLDFTNPPIHLYLLMLPSYEIQIDALHCGGYRVALLASADENNQSVKDFVTIYRNVTVNLQRQLEDVFGLSEAATGEMLYIA